MVAPPWYPLPPRGYGGIELVVTLLARGLRDRGHDVIVFGAEDSEEGVIGLAPVAWRKDLGRYETQALREVSYVSDVYRALIEDGLGEKLDVIHEHSGLVGLLAARTMARAPVLHTVHGPLTEGYRTAFTSLGDGIGLVAISHHQRSTAPGLNWVGTVHNAVDLDSLTTADRDDERPYLLVLARVCADKGQHIAIEVARRTGMRLVMAGKVENTSEGRAYYEHYIEPQLDEDRIVHIPNVAGEQKAQLLARATALLAPITWPEPFGLSMVEAICSGTPCIAFHQGAAPELIESGRTGFIVGNVEEMIDAVRRVDEIERGRCSMLGRHRFSPQAMVAAYEELYSAAADGLLDAGAPEDLGAASA